MRLERAVRTRSIPFANGCSETLCLLRGFEGCGRRDLEKGLRLIELSGVIQNVGSEFEKLVAPGLPSLATLDADQLVERRLYARQDMRFHARIRCARDRVELSTYGF